MTMPKEVVERLETEDDLCGVLEQSRRPPKSRFCQIPLYIFGCYGINIGHVCNYVM